MLITRAKAKGPWKRAERPPISKPPPQFCHAREKAWQFQTPMKVSRLRQGEIDHRQACCCSDPSQPKTSITVLNRHLGVAASNSAA